MTKLINENLQGYSYFDQNDTKKAFFEGKELSLFDLKALRDSKLGEKGYTI